MRSKISLVAALALTASVGFAAVGETYTINLDSQKWTLIGNSGYASASASQVTSAIATANSGTGLVVYTTGADNNSTLSVANLIKLTKDSSHSNEIGFRFTAETVTAGQAFSVVIKNSGNWVAEIEYDKAYVDSNNKFYFRESNASTTVTTWTELDFPKEGGVIDLVSTGDGKTAVANNVWADVSFNNATTWAAEDNLTVWGYDQAGAWKEYKYNTRNSSDTLAFLQDTNSTLFSSHNTKRGAGYWYKLDDASEDNATISIVDSGLALATDVDLHTNTAEGWSLVALPEDKMTNGQTGMFVNCSVGAGGISSINGIYNQSIDFTTFSAGTTTNTDEINVSGGGNNSSVSAADEIKKLNHILALNSSGSSYLNIKAYPAKWSDGTAEVNGTMLISSHDFNVSFGGTCTASSLAGVDLLNGGSADGTTRYGEQAVAVTVNQDLMSVANGAGQLKIQLPGIATYDVNLSGQTTVTGVMQEINATLMGYRGNSTDALTAGDFNLTLFGTEFAGDDNGTSFVNTFSDANVTNVLIAVKAPRDRTGGTINGSNYKDSYLRLGVAEGSYVKVFENNIQGGVGDGNLSLVDTSSGTIITADANISDNGYRTFFTDNSLYDFNLTADGNFTYLLTNDRFVDLFEVNRSEDNITDITLATAGTYTRSNSAEANVTITKGYITNVYTLDKLAESAITTGQTSTSGLNGQVTLNTTTDNLKINYVWSVSVPKSGLLYDILSTKGHKVDDVWTFKNGEWFHINTSEDPAKWNTYTMAETKAAVGYWVKSTPTTTTTLTATPDSSDTTINVITHYNNSASTTTNYVMLERGFTIDGVSSTHPDAKKALYAEFNSDVGVGEFATIGQYNMHLNPYVYADLKENVGTMTMNGSVKLYDGFSQGTEGTFTTTYSKPSTPAIKIVNNTITGLTSMVTNLTTDGMLLYSGNINEANVSENIITSIFGGSTSTILPSIDDNITTIRAVNRAEVKGTNDTTTGTGGYLVSDIQTLSYAPVFALTSYDTANQTPLLDTSDTNVTVSSAEIINLVNVLTSTGSTATKADKYVTNTTGTFLTKLDNTADTVTYEGYIVNAVNNNGVQVTSLTGCSTGAALAYEPAKVYSYNSIPPLTFVVRDATSGTALARVQHTADYNSTDYSMFYLYCNNGGTETVYEGNFSITNHDNSEQNLTAITGASQCFGSTAVCN